MVFLQCWPVLSWGLEDLMQNRKMYFYFYSEYTNIYSFYFLVETSFHAGWHLVGRSERLLEIGIPTLISIVITLISIVF